MNKIHIFAILCILASASLIAGTLTTTVLAQGTTTPSYDAGSSMGTGSSNATSGGNTTSGASVDNSTTAPPA